MFASAQSNYEICLFLAVILFVVYTVIAISDKTWRTAVLGAGLAFFALAFLLATR